MEKNAQKKEQKNISKIIQENHGWLIPIITGVGFIILNALRFLEYITANAYFSYYGLDINLYKYYDQNFLYGICLNIIFMFAMGSIMYCFNQICNNLKNRRIINKSNFNNFLIICLSNTYLICVMNIEINLRTIILNLIVIFIIEMFFSFLAFRKNKRIVNDEFSKEEFNKLTKSLPFLIIIFLIFRTGQIYHNLSLKKEYRLIDNTKVIVYSNVDYYLTLDCEIKENNIIIYKGTQEKINNDKIYSKLTKFDKVKIKQ